MFRGTFTALVTPFSEHGVDKNGLDEKALERLIDGQIAAGISGLVPCGTTGETPTLSSDEYARVIELTVERAKGKCAVIAGTGSNSTAHTIQLTKKAKALGADAALVVAPYYNKPTQEGLFQHFRAVAAEGGLPVMMYNIPGRTGVDLTADTVVRLQDVAGIVSIKEASGSCDRVGELRERCRADFTILSGDDSLTLPFISVGADGVVSVASNVLPEKMVALVKAALRGDLAAAGQHHAAMRRLFSALFLESNPAPAKAALALLDRMAPTVRLPLVSVSERTKTLLDEAIKAAGPAAAG